MSVQLPHGLDGVAPTVPNTSHTPSLAAGWYYRVARGHPTPHKSTLKSLRKYTREWCSTHLTQLDPGSDCSLDTWLEGTMYNESRKETIRRQVKAWEDGNLSRSKLNRVRGFAKEESYGPETKHLRSINSRSDAYKGLVGPITKLMEKEVFRLPWFIKKIPGHLRAQYIMDNVHTETGTYVCTDYTSFESSFTPAIMSNIEFVVYEYLTRTLPEGKEFMALYRQQLKKNRIQYRGFSAEVWGTRMSGEMNTSLGNGLTNLILFSWACHHQGIEWRGVVEGDDGLFNVSKVPDFGWITAAGFTVKPVVHENIGTASFCGQVFDPMEMQVVRDPVKALVKFGWSTSIYKNSRLPVLRALARSRALSMCYENPSCPVLWKFSRKVLRDTEGVSIDRILRNTTNEYERERLNNALLYGTPPEKEPGPATRELVGSQFGVDPPLQKIIESRIECLGYEERLRFPRFLMEIDKYEWMWDEYVSAIEPVFAKNNEIRGEKGLRKLFNDEHVS